MSTYDEMDIEVYTVLFEQDRVCDFGEKHRVTVNAKKILGPVCGRRQHDNGYEKRMTEVRMDEQGRMYHCHVEIDFYNNVWWRRDTDGARFYTRPKGLAFDVLGRRL